MCYGFLLAMGLSSTDSSSLSTMRMRFVLGCGVERRDEKKLREAR